MKLHLPLHFLFKDKYIVIGKQVSCNIMIHHLVCLNYSVKGKDYISKAKKSETGKSRMPLMKWLILCMRYTFRCLSMMITI